MFFFGLSGLFLLFMGFVALLLPVLCIIDIAGSQFNDDTNKIVWILVVLFLPFLGSLLYLLIGRGQKRY